MSSPDQHHEADDPHEQEHGQLEAAHLGGVAVVGQRAAQRVPAAVPGAREPLAHTPEEIPHAGPPSLDPTMPGCPFRNARQSMGRPNAGCRRVDGERRRRRPAPAGPRCDGPSTVPGGATRPGPHGTRRKARVQEHQRPALPGGAGAGPRVVGAHLPLDERRALAPVDDAVVLRRRGGSASPRPACGTGSAVPASMSASTSVEQLGPDGRQLAREGCRWSRRPRASPGAARRASPASTSSAIRWTETPVSRSPARMAAAIGEGPRYRGSSEGCTFTPPRGKRSRNAWRKMRPKATTTSSSGARPRTASWIPASRRSASSTRRPSARAASFTSDGRVERPRPAGWSRAGEHGAYHVRPGDGLQRGHGDAGRSREQHAHQSRSLSS